MPACNNSVCACLTLSGICIGLAWLELVLKKTPTGTMKGMPARRLLITPAMPRIPSPTFHMVSSAIGCLCNSVQGQDGRLRHFVHMWITLRPRPCGSVHSRRTPQTRWIYVGMVTEVPARDITYGVASRWCGRREGREESAVIGPLAMCLICATGTDQKSKLKKRLFLPLTTIQVPAYQGMQAVNANA
ncbi:hypothetical protein F4777DRAFT_335766 [Nemania sp. FL0916]|nr:hypothetical protein F4777DRAFT_335766 [Nemania sp. FL0916]